MMNIIERNICITKYINMPTNNKLYAQREAQKNRSNYNQWKSIWDFYKSTSEYKDLRKWMDGQGYIGQDPIESADSYINQLIPLMMRADSVSNVRYPSPNDESLRFFKVPEFSKQASALVDEFKNIPTEDKKYLIKFFGDNMVDKNSGTLRKNIKWDSMFSDIFKNPKILKYLPLATRAKKVFKDSDLPNLYPDSDGRNIGYTTANIILEHFE